jgi:predicted secreted protein
MMRQWSVLWRRTIAFGVWILLLEVGMFLHSVDSLSLERASIPASKATSTTGSVSVSVSVPAPAPEHLVGRTSRRAWMSSLLLSTASLSVGTCNVAAASAAATNGGDVTLTIQSAKDRIGLELIDVVIGNPPRAVVAIRRVVNYNNNINSKYLQPGMVLRAYSYAVDVQQQLAKGPYPVQLTFSNLAAAGDAISDVGTPLVTSQDALDLARQTSSDDSRRESNGTPEPNPYSITLLRDTEKVCNIPSRRNDVLEIRYQAKIGGPDGIIYDSSATRGTGQPYQMVMGSGDMLSGVDQGLYDMCPGQVRGLYIPPMLAYGRKGNKAFRVPADTPIYWVVELVSVNGVRQGDPRTRDEMEGRFAYQ